MPNYVSPSSSVSPSTTRSLPVQDVLKGIRVRDPKHKAFTFYRRRMEDFDVHGPISMVAAICMGTAILVGGLSLILPYMTSQIPESQQTVPSLKRPLAQEDLRIPRAIPTAPVPLERQQGAQTPEVLGPQNVRLNFIGPRTVEVRWDALGEGYHYLLYSAATPTFENATLLIQPPVPSSSAVWLVDEGIESAYLAVQGIDPEGHATPLSRPMLVTFPPAG